MKAFCIAGWRSCSRRRRVLVTLGDERLVENTNACVVPRVLRLRRLLITTAGRRASSVVVAGPETSLLGVTQV